MEKLFINLNKRMWIDQKELFLKLKNCGQLVGKVAINVVIATIYKLAAGIVERVWDKSLTLNIKSEQNELK